MEKAKADILNGKVVGGAIFGLNGSIWDATNGYYGNEAEMKAIADLFGQADEITSRQIIFNGEPYAIIEHTKESIICSHGETRLIVVRCPICFVLGYHDVRSLLPMCYNSVRTLAEEISCDI